MPVILAQRSLSDAVLNDNHDWDIPVETYEAVVAPLLKDITALGLEIPSSVQFDPDRHLLFTDDYYDSTRRLTLQELGITETHQPPISSIGVSEAFPMFTKEAITIMRWELFQKSCFLQCGRVSNHSTTGDHDFYVRGYTAKYTPFTYAAWKHPRTLEIISKMAGVELVHQLDYEIGHINFSVKRDNNDFNRASPNPALTEKARGGDESCVVPWHYDSPQFVCVLMMSETTDMIGGETVLKMGNGEVARVEGPKQGWCNVLQGRILKHQGTRPSGTYKERITSVCSLRPKDTMLDESPLTTVKPSLLSGSRYNDFYQEYMNHRLNVLQDRMKVLQNRINDSISNGEKFDQIGTINFIQNRIVEYAEHTWQEFEVVDDGLVEKPKSYNVKQSIFY